MVLFVLLLRTIDMAANAARFFGHGCRAGGASRDDGRMQRTQPVAAVTIALVY
jgi:hypothetical protein